VFTEYVETVLIINGWFWLLLH